MGGWIFECGGAEERRDAEVLVGGEIRRVWSCRGLEGFCGDPGWSVGWGWG